jgi:hypothetical protein
MIQDEAINLLLGVIKEDLKILDQNNAFSLLHLLFPKVPESVYLSN